MKLGVKEMKREYKKIDIDQIEVCLLESSFKVLLSNLKHTLEFDLDLWNSCLLSIHMFIKSDVIDLLKNFCRDAHVSILFESVSPFYV